MSFFGGHNTGFGQQAQQQAPQQSQPFVFGSAQAPLAASSQPQQQPSGFSGFGGFNSAPPSSASGLSAAPSFSSSSVTSSGGFNSTPSFGGYTPSPGTFGVGGGGGGFGSTAQQQTTNAAFGAASSSSVASPFGTSQQQHHQQQQQLSQPAFTGFGTSSNLVSASSGNSRGASAGGGGGGFGTSSNIFASPPAPSFGSSSSSPGQQGLGQSTTGGIGSSAGGFGGFGGSTPTSAASGFGSAISQFGGGGFSGVGSHEATTSTTTTATPSLTFDGGGGGNIQSPFGGPSSSAAAAPQSTVSFGVSSNLLPTNTTISSASTPFRYGGGGFGTSSTFSSSSSPPLGWNASGSSSSSTINPFNGGGASSTTGGAGPTGMEPFGGTGMMQGGSDSENMNDAEEEEADDDNNGDLGGGGGGDVSASSFDTSSAGLSPVNSIGGPSIPRRNRKESGGRRSMLGSIPEEAGSSASSSTPFSQSAVVIDSKQETELTTTPSTTKSGNSENKNEELARLKAKLQEKIERKRRLEEKRRLKEEQSAAASADTASSGRSSSSSTSPVPPPSQAALAEKNAIRFASEYQGGGSFSKRLPAELHAKAREMQAAWAAKRAAANNDGTGSTVGEEWDGGGANEESDIGGAISNSTNNNNRRDALGQESSLIGTCPYMCPDEELITRELEGDIQLLETPDPGGLHPQNWTLRQTAVKRFRRSAADYKLNVPEWVRPPEVLERVCGYLEEWVMERDRQGPDPRYPQNPSPPSLDVYQFIWDRTRMIRKDFILQNYVGTGGKCDARAVRCHERIARWHTMCEHQLSHIPDYVIQQSQQNIQELGQTMKTLNLYYDDSMGRSTLEEVDENGKEIKPLTSDGPVHGCASEIVMGASPVDFDGTALNNSVPSAGCSRIIGSDSATRGTAEPEMRGLYILLTLNNDGGMEVLRYAAKLAVERPEIYNSKPVQLALKIYKAKKDYNYARFFSILRSPSTPYLFACIMFKYVEQMRKVAFRIMSKTYGARRRDTGEPMYDSYPLEDLVHLLCFEDMDEARDACRHYNITVREIQNDSSTAGSKKETMEEVLWRQSDYHEKRDPDKGTQMILRPWKMIRSIEGKLNGATRLAVCRGDVSGDGATLAKPVAVRRGSSVTLSPSLYKGRGNEISASYVEQMANDELRKRQAEAEALHARQEYERRLQEEVEKKKLEEAQRIKVEQEAERRRLELVRQREAEEARQRELRKEERAREIKRREAEEKERREREAEEIRKAAAAAEELRRREKERRIFLEKEAARKRAEEEERQKQREEELERKRQEEARRLRLIQEAEEARRREEEAARLLQIKLQHEREAEEERRRKAKEEEERRIAMEWKRKMDHARKVFVWRWWRQRLTKRHHRVEGTHRSLQGIDPTFSGLPALSLFPQDLPIAGNDMVHKKSKKRDLVPQESSSGNGAEQLFYRLGSDGKKPFNLSELIARDILCRKDVSFPYPGYVESSKSVVLLCKLAVLLPETHNPVACKGLRETVKMWINARLQFGKVVIDNVNQNAYSYEIRTVSVDATSDPDACRGCSVVLFIIPPLHDIQRPDCRESFPLGFSSKALSHISDDTPRMVLNLDDKSDAQYSMYVSDMVATLVGDESWEEAQPENRGVLAVAGKAEFFLQVESAFQACCEALMKAFVDGLQYNPLVERISLLKLGLRCIRKSLWKSGVGQNSNPVEEEIIESARSVLKQLVDELHALGLRFQESPLFSWPPEEFAKDSHGKVTGSAVEDYFPGNEALPLDWDLLLHRSYTVPKLAEAFEFLNGSFDNIIETMIADDSISLRQKCEIMLEKKQPRRCFEFALLRAEQKRDSSSTHLIYLPKGMVTNVINETLKKAQSENGAAVEQLEAATFGDERSRTDHFERENLENDMVKREPSELKSPEMPEVVLDARDVISNSFESLPEQLWGGAGKKRSNVLESSIAGKRPRYRKERISKDWIESMDFTAKLEALLKGDTIDMAVGTTSLAGILREEWPGIELPHKY